MLSWQDFSFLWNIFKHYSPKVDIMVDTEIKSSLSQKEYTNLMFGMFVKHPISIFMIVMGIFMLLSVAGGAVTGRFYVMLGIGFASMPLLMYLTIGGGYSNNKLFAETLTISFGQDTLDIAGQSFQSSYSWGDFKKAKVVKQYVIFYQGPAIRLILNQNEGNAQQFEELKSLMREKGLMK